ncbi:MAG: Fe-S cluster assembly protein SufD [Acidobacteriales bacterium]|nr:Fe-S cluster assembly protein SufD [Terriglobales bacterium]
MSTMTQTSGAGTYLDAFSELEQRGSKQPEWLRSLRQEAFASFCDTGFPTIKDEAWRFTSVAPISQTVFSLPEAGPSGVTRAEVEAFRIDGTACSLVFVNGRFAPELSDQPKLAAGVHAGSLGEALAGDTGALELQLGLKLALQNDAFSSLNTAFIEDGACIRIARGTVLEAPIHLLFLSTGAEEPLMFHHRNLIVAEANTQVGIVEEHISLADGVTFSNVVTELIAAENAVASHYMIERKNRQSFHVATLRIQQERSANVSSHSFLLGGALVRNNVHPVFAGEGGECLINGLFIGEDRQHLDNYMLVEHASPRCNSHQYYNGILNDHAHGVFHGRIIVHKDAQKTDSKQTNRNLLLSDDAQIDTKPQLEIYADDVKCTHGATIGQMDDNALFYLRSRGLDENAARSLLLFAFAGECTGRIKPGPVRAHIEKLVRRALPKIIANGEAGDGGEREDKGRNWEEVG